MKKYKTPLLYAAAFLIVFSGLAVYLWGWRVFGFGLCSPPGVSFVKSITITDTSFKMEGESNFEGVYYQGYTYVLEGTTLKLGLRYLRWPFSSSETFSISIPLSQPVEKVILVGKHRDVVLYE